ncbi:pyridoxamine 5'-phosphate oxidase family protein [Planococcus sp. APC 4015]|nr:pyridoxamine 5'-phosphate oxidase family protein [Planococcus sp. APC 4015]
MSSPNEKDRPAPAPQATPISHPEHDAIEHLSTAQCWALIEARSFGRLAVEGLDGMPDVFPLNYTVHDGSIFIRSAPGSKLMSIAAHPYAAFEIDGEDHGIHWSVVLRGAARRLAIDKEIRQSGVQSVLSFSPTDKFNYVCVTPSSISGRRFTQSSARSPHAPVTRPSAGNEPSRGYEETSMWTHADPLRQQAPVAIPHLPPR